MKTEKSPSRFDYGNNEMAELTRVSKVSTTHSHGGGGVSKKSSTTMVMGSDTYAFYQLVLRKHSCRWGSLVWELKESGLHPHPGQFRVHPDHVNDLLFADCVTSSIS
jgi:hypothetical protein